MIFWANPKAAETKAYVERYWEFQIAHKLASIQFRNGVLDVEFPPGAFRPVTYCQLAA